MWFDKCHETGREWIAELEQSIEAEKAKRKEAEAIKALVENPDLVIALAQMVKEERAKNTALTSELERIKAEIKSIALTCP